MGPVVVVGGTTVVPPVLVVEVVSEVGDVLRLLLVVLVVVGCWAVVVTWLPGKHWEYQSLLTTQVLPAQQDVGPVQPLPPH